MIFDHIGNTSHCAKVFWYTSACEEDRFECLSFVRNWVTNVPIASRLGKFSTGNVNCLRRSACTIGMVYDKFAQTLTGIGNIHLMQNIAVQQLIFIASGNIVWWLTKPGICRVVKNHCIVGVLCVFYVLMSF